FCFAFFDDNCKIALIISVKHAIIKMIFRLKRIPLYRSYFFNTLWSNVLVAYQATELHTIFHIDYGYHNAVDKLLALKFYIVVLFYCLFIFFQIVNSRYKTGFLQIIDNIPLRSLLKRPVYNCGSYRKNNSKDQRRNKAKPCS